MFRAAVFDPKTIFEQILLLQCGFYLALCLIVIICNLLFSIPIELSSVISARYFDINLPKGWAVVLAFVISSFFVADLLRRYNVRAKRCLDHVITLYLIHFIIVFVHDDFIFPKFSTFWITMTLSIILATVVGEHLCMKVEMQAISVGFTSKKKTTSTSSPSSASLDCSTELSNTNSTSASINMSSHIEKMPLKGGILNNDDEDRHFSGSIHNESSKPSHQLTFSSLNSANSSYLSTLSASPSRNASQNTRQQGSPDIESNVKSKYNPSSQSQPHSIQPTQQLMHLNQSTQYQTAPRIANSLSNSYSSLPVLPVLPTVLPLGTISAPLNPLGNTHNYNQIPSLQPLGTFNTLNASNVPSSLNTTFNNNGRHLPTLPTLPTLPNVQNLQNSQNLQSLPNLGMTDLNLARIKLQQSQQMQQNNVGNISFSSQQTPSMQNYMNTSYSTSNRQ